MWLLNTQQLKRERASNMSKDIEEALKKEAGEIYNRFYMILFDSDSYKSEEVNVSTLAKSCALEAVNLLEKQCKEEGFESARYDYLREVIKGL